MVTLDRRTLLGSWLLPAAAALAPAMLDPRRARAAEPWLAERAGGPTTLARDESFWLAIQQAFVVDRSVINLDNAGVSPAPAGVQTATDRHRAHGHATPAHTLWRVQAPKRESVRHDLARLFGCDAEEVAITRNATESLHIVQMGLDLTRGDEVVTSTQDYPRMVAAFAQRQRREGVVLRQVRLPRTGVRSGAVVRRFANAMTPRTRLILASHMVNLTGEVLPIRALVAMARTHGVPVLVDGAQAFGHLPFRQADLACDFYAASLHKWLNAPHGTGMLYVRRSRIRSVWPLMAAPASMDDDIRKFEEIGTHPLAGVLAVADALAFHRGIGVERKAARLRHLRDRWLDRAARLPGARVRTPRDPRLACGIATVDFEGIDPQRLVHRLWRRHRILVAGIDHPEVRGIRVSPGIYTTRDEIDRFSEALRDEVGVPTKG